MAAQTFAARDVFTVAGFLSLSRLGFAACFPWAAARTSSALAVLALAAASDMLDGYVARRRHTVTPTGAMLDPIADKLFAASVVLSLLGWRRLSLGAAALLCARELAQLPLGLWLVCGPRARLRCAAHLGASPLGKLTTALQFAALLAVLVNARAADALVIATALLGLLAAGSYWLRARAVAKAAPLGSGDHDA